MSRGKNSYGERPHFVATREHSKTLITHCPHLRFLSRLFHTRPEDNTTRGQRRWRCGTTGYRVEVNTGRHDDLRASIQRCFNHRHHRSLESDAQDDHHRTRKTYSGAHRPQDLIFSILDIRDTKFMQFETVGHYLT